mmetsp:Transcript_18899/g.26653  ORF Transcript_18899/g.26653 Transcript_18899/m.26653 type:complete len:261 (-) Transcript_18899:182-964(-)
MKFFLRKTKKGGFQALQEADDRSMTLSPTTIYDTNGQQVLPVGDDFIEMNVQEGGDKDVVMGNNKTNIQVAAEKDNEPQKTKQNSSYRSMIQKQERRRLRQQQKSLRRPIVQLVPEKLEKQQQQQTQSGQSVDYCSTADGTGSTQGTVSVSSDEQSTRSTVSEYLLNQRTWEAANDVLCFGGIDVGACHDRCTSILCDDGDYDTSDDISEPQSPLPHQQEEEVKAEVVEEVEEVKKEKEEKEEEEKEPVVSPVKSVYGYI